MAQLLCLLTLLFLIHLNPMAMADTTPADVPTKHDHNFASQRACFRAMRGRGRGLPKICPHGYEEDGNKCYLPCNKGYTGKQEMCLMSCPPGFADTGLSCTNMWAKGCCCQGCCDLCPDDHMDIGCLCAKNVHKDTHPRQPGVNMVCPPGQDESEGVCYPECSNGEIGLGPVCLDKRHLEEVDPDKKFPYQCDHVGIFHGMDEETCHFVNKEIRNATGLSNACVAAVLGSAVMPVLRLEAAASICGSHLSEAVAAINNILKYSGARSCNPSAQDICSSASTNCANGSCRRPYWSGNIMARNEVNFFRNA